MSASSSKSATETHLPTQIYRDVQAHSGKHIAGVWQGMLSGPLAVSDWKKLDERTFKLILDEERRGLPREITLTLTANGVSLFAPPLITAASSSSPVVEIDNYEAMRLSMTDFVPYADLGIVEKAGIKALVPRDTTVRDIAVRTFQLPGNFWRSLLSFFTNFGSYIAGGSGTRRLEGDTSAFVNRASDRRVTELYSLLHIFLDTLKKHDIPEHEVRIIGGTLIGAMRHRGFFDWDDDVDLAMRKEVWQQIMQKPALLQELRDRGLDLIESPFGPQLHVALGGKAWVENKIGVDYPHGFMDVLLLVEGEGDDADKYYFEANDVSRLPPGCVDTAIEIGKRRLKEGATISETYLEPLKHLIKRLPYDRGPLWMDRNKDPHYILKSEWEDYGTLPFGPLTVPGFSADTAHGILERWYGDYKNAYLMFSHEKLEFLPGDVIRQIHPEDKGPVIPPVIWDNMRLFRPMGVDKVAMLVAKINGDKRALRVGASKADKVWWSTTLFVPGSFDPSHYGHNDTMKRLRKKLAQEKNLRARRIRLLAGISPNYKPGGDALPLQMKFRLLASLEEVNEVVVAPLILTQGYMRKHGIDFVGAGDDYDNPELADYYYPGLREAGRLITVPRSDGISSTDYKKILAKGCFKRIESQLESQLQKLRPDSPEAQKIHVDLSYLTQAAKFTDK